ncbi:MAG: hypothetical protein QNL62_12410 [Gammaproteobacteria bacterium]|nr:hypothetical protein [Gammaproteobacteria bacterium]
MSDFLNNDIVQWVLGTLIGGLILGIFGWLKFRRDEQIVTEFLKKSGIENNRRYTTTHEISSVTNLSKKRIRKVCSKSSRIKRNKKEKESWRIS